MAISQRQVRQTTVHDGLTDDTVQEVHDERLERAHATNVAERVVWFVAGVLLALLGLRFIFALLGANPSNGFANFIYSVTHPFVSPFFSLFGYNYSNGVARFESYTLVAMLIYALIAWGIARLVTIRRP